MELTSLLYFTARTQQLDRICSQIKASNFPLSLQLKQFFPFFCLSQCGRKVQVCLHLTPVGWIWGLTVFPSPSVADSSSSPCILAHFITRYISALKRLTVNFLYCFGLFVLFNCLQGLWQSHVVINVIRKCLKKVLDDTSRNWVEGDKLSNLPHAMFSLPAHNK